MNTTPDPVSAANARQSAFYTTHDRTSPGDGTADAHLNTAALAETPQTPLQTALAEERKMADLSGYYDGTNGTGADYITAKAQTDALVAAHAVQQPNRTERPDDSEADAAIADAGNLSEAMWEIAEKYQVPVTNNYPRWQDGQWLREIGEFIGDIRKAIERFTLPIPETPEEFGAAIGTERSRQIEKGYNVAHDDEHGAQHLINWAIDYARRGENVKVGALLLALGELLYRQAAAIPATGEDERIMAWDAVARHPFFRECYETDGTLLAAMIAKLDDLDDVPTAAQWDAEAHS